LSESDLKSGVVPSFFVSSSALGTVPLARKAARVASATETTLDGSLPVAKSTTPLAVRGPE